MKKLIPIFFVLSILFMITQGAFAQYVSPEMEWDFGHALEVGTPTGQAALKFAEVMSELSDGKITVNVYPSGQIGSESELIQGCMYGTVDFNIASTATLGNSDPNWRIFDMPLVLANYEEAYKCMDSNFGHNMLDSMLPNINVKGLNYIDCGFTEILQNHGVIRTPMGYDGLTIRCTESNGFITALTSMGANPVTSATSETFTLVQNGTVDGTCNPIATWYTSSFYEIAKYMNRNYMWFTPVILMCSGDLWNSLDTEVQAWVVEASNEADLIARKTREEMEEFWLSEMVAAGVKVEYYTDEERQVWVEFMEENMYPKLVPDTISQELFDNFRNSVK